MALRFERLRVYLICTTCGEEDNFPAYDFMDGINVAKRNGWMMRKDEESGYWNHYHSKECLPTN